MRTPRVIITGVISMIAVVILAGVALARDPSAPPAAPPVTDTGFTYQGFVRDGEQPASGAYDFQFALFNAINGIQVGSTIAKDDLPVVNGLVSTLLDFGPGVFDGSELWLETRTRKGDQTGAFDTLTPRQRINPVPYATYAYDGPFWMLGGNAGTTPDSNFVGTTDAQPLVFKVNNHEAMRIVPGGTTGDNVGINAPNPQAKLHVRWADSGAEPPAQVKSLIVETNHDGDGIALLQSDGKSVRITFGSPADNDAGRVLYKTSPDNYMAFWTAGSEKMRIGPTGNVGIGRSNPNNKLEVAGRISIRETDDAVLQMVANKGSDSYIQWVEKDVDQRGVLGFAKGSPDLVYHAQASDLTNPNRELFRITSDGEVGIGIKDPNEKLAVAGIIQSTTGGFKFPDGTVQTTAASGSGGEHVCV
ncbi:MAG: hypothetical protein IIB17_11520, partial [Chloroflexi bacterium]|nr:hypothetical protein [Chloroflexota bacterium]